jgi:hypothetical protein
VLLWECREKDPIPCPGGTDWHAATNMMPSAVMIVDNVLVILPDDNL